jgi:hypothetical protein
MLSSHSSFLAFILKKTDPTILKTTKQKLSEDGMCKRIFDDFPNLLPENLMNQLQENLLAILLGMQPSAVMIIDNYMELNDLTSQQRMMEWEKIIIRIACAELLDEQGGIKDDIRQLLHWERALNPKEVHNVLCSYVGAVSQIAMAQCADKVDVEIYVAVCKYLTDHYGQWIKQATERQRSPVVSFALEHPQAMMGMGVLALGIMMGATLYQQRSQSFSPDDSPKQDPSFRPS